MKKVIFDTNFLLEKRMKHFFGKQEELAKFEKLAEIIIPDMVIGELKNRYMRDFHMEKDKFNRTLLPNITTHNINDLTIEVSVNKLLDEESISYSIVELTDPSCLFEIKEMSLRKTPPFVPQNGSDKGFKDAYIYFTILEYLQGVEDKSIFVVTDDKLLKSALESKPNIVVVSNYDEFKENTISEYKTDYFIEKFQTELKNIEINEKSIIDYWFNINENRVLLLDIDEERYVVEIDSGEIVAYEKLSAYLENIDTLISSTEFDITHLVIEELNQYLHFLSDDEIIRILGATNTNEQIYRIIDKEDVKQFISTLYDQKKEILSTELKVSIKQKLEE